MYCKKECAKNHEAVDYSQESTKRQIVASGPFSLKIASDAHAVRVLNNYVRDFLVLGGLAIVLGIFLFKAAGDMILAGLILFTLVGAFVVVRKRWPLDALMAYFALNLILPVVFAFMLDGYEYQNVSWIFSIYLLLSSVKAGNAFDRLQRSAKGVGLVVLNYQRLAKTMFWIGLSAAYIFLILFSTSHLI